MGLTDAGSEGDLGPRLPYLGPPEGYFLHCHLRDHLAGQLHRGSGLDRRGTELQPALEVEVRV